MNNIKVCNSVDCMHYSKEKETNCSYFPHSHNIIDCIAIERKPSLLIDVKEKMTNEDRIDKLLDFVEYLNKKIKNLENRLTSKD